jgi:hypothetical protein
MDTVMDTDMASFVPEQEEMDKRSSALVAPLNIQKSPRRSQSRVGRGVTAGSRPQEELYRAGRNHRYRLL